MTLGEFIEQLQEDYPDNLDSEIVFVDTQHGNRWATYVTSWVDTTINVEGRVELWIC